MTRKRTCGGENSLQFTSWLGRKEETRTRQIPFNGTPTVGHSIKLPSPPCGSRDVPYPNYSFWITTIKTRAVLDLAVHTYNPSTQEAEVGGSCFSLLNKCLARQLKKGGFLLPQSGSTGRWTLLQLGSTGRWMLLQSGSTGRWTLLLNFHPFFCLTVDRSVCLST